MAINSTSRLVRYTGNGSATVFSFAFKVFLAGDLYVVLNVSGVSSVLTLGTDYTVTIDGNQDTNPGGSVTLLGGALATGNTLVLTSDVAELQQLILTNLGGFYPDVLNAALDRLTIFVQQLSTLLGTTLRFDITDDSTTAQLPPAAERAGKFLYFDETGSVSLLSGNIGLHAETVTATEGQTDFTLPSSSALVMLASQNGIVQPSTAYSATGGVLSFTFPWSSGDTLYYLAAY